jgi:hypothetical protein
VQKWATYSQASTYAVEFMTPHVIISTGASTVFLKYQVCIIVCMHTSCGVSCISMLSMLIMLYDVRCIAKGVTSELPPQPQFESGTDGSAGSSQELVVKASGPILCDSVKPTLLQAVITFTLVCFPSCLSSHLPLIAMLACITAPSASASTGIAARCRHRCLSETYSYVCRWPTPTM